MIIQLISGEKALTKSVILGHSTERKFTQVESYRSSRNIGCEFSFARICIKVSDVSHTSLGYYTYSLFKRLLEPVLRRIP